MRNLIIGTSMIFAVLFASCGNDNKEVKGAETQIKEYKTVTLQPINSISYIAYPASIQGQQNIEIRPRVEGYIEKIYVDEGSIVKKGQPLFKISAPQYEQEVRTAAASVKSAEAEVSAAKLGISKVTPLVEKQIISKYELESAQYKLSAAQAILAQGRASLANARTNVGFTTVNSPVNGVVGSILFRLGSLVSSANPDPLTTVSSIGNVYAYFAFNEKKLLNFSKDSAGTTAQKIAKLPQVNLILSDGSLYAEKGKIETINGLINTETGSVTVRARFPNNKGLIRSGSSAKVQIPEQIKKAIIIPQSATFELQDKHFAAIVDKNGKTKNVVITVRDVTIGTFYIVESGLKAGDQIVLEGVAVLKDGSQIKPVEENQQTVYETLKL